MDEPRSVKDGAEDTNERVVTPHTEMCEDCEVTSVEEGHDVERVIARNDEIMEDVEEKRAPECAMEQSVGVPVPQIVETERLKDETSADLTAFEKKGLDRKTNHHDPTNAKSEEIFVLTRAIGEKETVALKLEQIAKEVAQRPPPCAKSEKQSHNKGQ